MEDGAMMAFAFFGALGALLFPVVIAGIVVLYIRYWQRELDARITDLEGMLSEIWTQVAGPGAIPKSRSGRETRS